MPRHADTPARFNEAEAFLPRISSREASREGFNEAEAFLPRISCLGSGL